MNLSSRLDAARRQRDQDAGDKVGRHPLDLRYATEEGQTYDGRALRTGEELTDESWAERGDSRDTKLPSWTPEPGTSFADSEGLIDLTEVGPAVPPPETAPLPSSSEPDIELPKWADQQPLDVAPAAPVPTGRATGSCVNCGGDPRVDVFDMVSGIAHLECTGCGFKWQAVTEHRLPPQP